MKTPDKNTPDKNLLRIEPASANLEGKIIGKFQNSNSRYYISDEFLTLPKCIVALNLQIVLESN